MSRLNVFYYDANSVNPDEITHFVASHLGLYCLQIFRLRDARHKWVDPMFINWHTTHLDKNISYIK